MPKCDDVVTLQGEVYIRKGSMTERKVANVKSIQKHPFVLGRQWVIVTPTLWYVGTLKSVTDQWLVLEQAAWLADTGRFSDFMKTGNTKELEPCNGPAVIGVGAVICAMPSPVVNIEVK